MSEQSSFDDLAASTLENARRLRAEAITEKARDGLQADDQLVRQGSCESRLAQEVTALTLRMEWLQAHPLLRRFVGRSAVQLTTTTGQPPRLETPIILEHDTQVADEHVLTSGYIFWTYPHLSYGGRQLHIQRAVKDATTGYEQRSDAYRLYMYAGKLGTRVQVLAESFDAYAEEQVQRVVADFAKSQPWVKAYDIGKGEYYGSHIHRSVYPRKESPEYDRYIREWEYGGDLLEWIHEEQIREELLPQLDPGAGWDYRDDMFLEPLSLVMQAHDALGRRK